MGNRITGPDDAYKNAQGQTIKHPLGFDIKIDTPLDFMGVTDHSEYVGITREANTPGSYVSTLPELAQIAMVFQAQWRRDPTPAQLGQLVENRIQERCSTARPSRRASTRTTRS
jgi:hypothetical protein